MILLLAVALMTQPAQEPPAVRLDVNKIPALALRSDGFGICPAFTHYHAYDASNPLLDGKCHADSDDRAIADSPAAKTRALAPHP